MDCCECWTIGTGAQFGWLTDESTGLVQKISGGGGLLGRSKARCLQYLYCRCPDPPTYPLSGLLLGAIMGALLVGEGLVVYLSVTMRDRVVPVETAAICIHVGAMPS